MRMVVLVLAVSTAMIFVSNGYGAYTDGLVQYWDFSQGDVGKDVTASDIVDVLSVGSEKALSRPELTVVIHPPTRWR